jgi:hypothetical protein
MKHQLYFPARHAEQLAWLKHLRHQLTQVAEQLRLGELTGYTLVEALRDLDWLIYVMGPVMTQMRTQMKAITAVQKALLTGPAFGSGDPAQLPAMTLPEPPAGPPVKAGALKRIFKLVATIKVRTGYTTAVGKALGIVGNHYVKEADAPTFKLEVRRGAETEEVHGRFKRYGQQGVYVETRRGGGEWEPLGHAGLHTGHRLVDSRPLVVPGEPEVREYRMSFWADEGPRGEWSGTLQVTVSP